jgi:hypothetical protein
MDQIETLHLFHKLTSKLISLLKEMPLTDWDRPSSIDGRTFKVLVSHLIDGSLRRLSVKYHLH